MRDELVQFGEAWEAFGYDVRLWTEQNLPELQNQRVYDELETHRVNAGGQPPHVARYVQRADVVAYELVWQFGGIVANCDIEPVRRLTIVDGVPAWAGFELQNVAVCNALIGAAAPHHPFWQACIDRIAERWPLERYEPMERVTGPGCITGVWEDRDDLTVFEQGVFYPFSFVEMEREWWDWPDAYVRHHWGHTRGRWSEPRRGDRPDTP
jgi:mannosyltransferase OCH1-like enzyme